MRIDRPQDQDRLLARLAGAALVLASLTLGAAFHGVPGAHAGAA